MTKERLVNFLERGTALSKLLRLRLAQPVAGPGLGRATLAPVKPAIAGLSRASDVLRAAHALSFYRGEGNVRRAETSEAGGRSLVHELRPRVNRKHRARTALGLHAGWDRYAADRAVSVQDAWKN